MLTRIDIFVPTSLKRELKEFSQKKEQSLSELMRYLLRKGLDEEKRKEDYNE